jgi:hypothetical protein
MKEAVQTVVFICWSDQRSRALAAELRNFLGSVIQSVQPYMSDKDIQAGEAWDERLTEMIRAARFGIACVTAENQDSPWLHFEAGALSNAVEEEKRLCPYLFGLRKADLRQPLARFQAKETNETDTFALIESINALCTPPLQPDRLRSVFGKFWPDFEKAVKAIAKDSKEAVTTSVQDERINEILTTVRDLARAGASAYPYPSHRFPIRFRTYRQQKQGSRSYIPIPTAVGCYICHGAAVYTESSHPLVDTYDEVIECLRCGKYEITREATSAVEDKSSDRLLLLQQKTLSAIAVGTMLRITKEMVDNL